MPIKNLIITGANTAREINDLEKPTMEKYGYVQDIGWMYEDGEQTYYELLKLWKQEESSLKEYRIVNKIQQGKYDMPPEGSTRYVVGKGKSRGFKYAMVGLKFECECNDQDLTCVIL